MIHSVTLVESSPTAIQTIQNNLRLNQFSISDEISDISSIGNILIIIIIIL